MNVAPHFLRGAFGKIKDPRRVVARSFDPTKSAADLTWIPERASLQDKRTLRPPLSGDRRTALHVPYIGVLKIGDGEGEEIVVVQGDKLIANSRLFWVPFKGRVMQPAFHAFALAHAAWLKETGIADSYAFAPELGGDRYSWWMGRERFVDAALIGLIAGRPIQHIRVWQGRGLLATNGTDRLYFMESRNVLTAAIADHAFSEEDWQPVYSTGNGPIWFMAAVFARGDQTFLPIQLTSRREVDVELSDPEEMIAVFAAEQVVAARRETQPA